MKLLLGAKKYLEESELKKKKEMEVERDGIDSEELIVPDPRTIPLKIVASVVFHPFDYAKNLIMMGYEPLPPYQAPWFGRTYYMYPNVFKYVGHIYSVDGLLGCFRGIFSKSTSLLLQTSLINYFDKKYPAPPMKAPLLDKLKRNVAVKCICTIASHPLQIMTVQCIAQFVGRETKLSEWNLLSNVLTIFKLEGLAGFFKGFWARLAGEICMVASSIIIVHGIYSWRKTSGGFESDQPEAAQEQSMVLYSTVVNFACVSYFYPYNVISTTMMVNQTGLKIGEPPLSPLFHNSFHCYSYLNYMNQLKRGSGLFYRWVPTVSRSEEILKIKAT